MERSLSSPDPIVMGTGAARILRTTAQRLPEINCPRRRVVSLTGSIAPDGSAAHFNVVFTVSGAVKAPFFPMLPPVTASSASEREMLHARKNHACRTRHRGDRVDHLSGHRGGR
jgi:DNA-binding transcriptional regulator LsrR (DeoR family)